MTPLEAAEELDRRAEEARDLLGQLRRPSEKLQRQIEAYEAGSAALRHIWEHAQLSRCPVPERRCR